MATIVAKMASSSSSPTNKTLSSSLYRLLSINFQRSLSTSPTLATESSAASKKPKRKKKKNLFEVAQFLPNWGIGFHMAKSHWTNVSYELTKINLNKDGRHGKAWGIAYKDGLRTASVGTCATGRLLPRFLVNGIPVVMTARGLPVVDAPKKISGVHKRCWRYIPGLTKLKESEPTPPKSTEIAEVQAA